MAILNYPQGEDQGSKKRLLFDIIKKAASRHNVDPLLIESVISQESRGNPNAVSSAGAQGVMQLMPGTAKELGVKNPFDPAENIEGGTKYLSNMLKRFGSEPLALAAYNSGPGRVEKYGDDLSKYPAETRDYVPKIMTKFGVKKAASAAESPFDTPEAPFVSPMQAQGQSTVSPKEESPYMEQIRELLKPKKQSKWELIGNLLRGAGGVTAAFGNPDHAEEITARLSHDMNLRKGTKAAELKNLLDVIKLDKEGRPSSVKEYEYYTNQETKAGRTPKDFFNWQLENRQAGAMTINPLNQSKADFEQRYKNQQLDMDREKLQLQKDKESREINKKEKGHIMPADKAFTLAEGSSLPQMIDKLKTTIESNKDILGPVVGRVRSLNPWDKKIQKIDGDIARVRQIVGKFMEGGVLRKEDEAKYEKILTSLSNDPTIASEKLEGLKDELQGKYNTYIDSLDKAGYDVTKFDRLGGQTQKANPRSSTPPPTAGASSALPPQKSTQGGMTDRQKTLLKFAQENPNDPQSKEILNLLGGN